MEHLAGRSPKFLKDNEYKNENEQILKILSVLIKWVNQTDVITGSKEN